VPKPRANPYYPKKPFPMLAVWELTFACNMRCRHCGSNAGATCTRATASSPPRKHSTSSTSWRRWETSASRCREASCSCAATGTGSRPPQAPQDRGGLITNGFLLDHNLPRLEKILPVEVVGISLDGTRATHDRIRRIKGAYDRVVRGFQSLKRSRSAPRPSAPSASSTSASSRRCGAP